MKKLILILLLVVGLFTNAQVQPPFAQRTNGTFTPVDPWLSVPKGINLSNILPSITTEPDYRIIVIPDIQFETQDHPDILNSMFQWIHDSASYYNVKAIIQLGDITQLGTVAQFVTASDAAKHIDSTGIPYAFTTGNHDYDSVVSVPTNLPNRIVNNYNAYFGPSRYAGKPFYGGNYNNSNENFYIKFDAGSTKYISIQLEYIPRDSSLAWAQRVLDSFPDRKAIIATHSYISFYGEKSVDTTRYVNDSPIYGHLGNAGQAMWDKLIKKNKQISMVFCGHQIHPVLYLPVVHRISEAGTNGNIVHQILTNYQDDLNGGNGYMMIVTVSPSTGTVNMKMFSPTLQVTDTRFPPFTLGYPETKVNPILSISSNYGGLYNAGETRLDSDLFITKLPPYKFVVTEKNGRLDTLKNQSPHKFLGGGLGSSDSTAYFRNIDTTDLPVSIGKFVQNKTTSKGTAPPTSTPVNIGDLYIDTTNKKLYFAAGTSSSADWIILN